MREAEVPRMREAEAPSRGWRRSADATKSVTNKATKFVTGIINKAIKGD